MKSTGYILNGQYYDSLPDVEALRETHVSLEKAYSHDRQREEHRRDLIQPWTRDGKPNPEFVSEYPEEARNYGFIGENS